VSAPTVSVLLAKHVGDMLYEIAADLSLHGRENGYGSGMGVRARIEWSPHYTTQPFHVFLDEGLSTFQGSGSDAGAALLAANSKRQSHYERLATRSAPAIDAVLSGGSAS